MYTGELFFRVKKRKSEWKVLTSIEPRRDRSHLQSGPIQGSSPVLG